MIKLIHVVNPLVPTRDSKVYSLPFYESDALLYEYLNRFFALVPDIAQDSFVSLNGGIVQRDDWYRVTPRDGDCIVVAPVVQGGNILKTLASVAVIGLAVVATAGLGLAAAAIVLGGNLLISHFLGANKATKSISATYDPDGPRSLARSGTVIPKGYGTLRWGGNIIASYTDTDGVNQYLNALVCFGFGPARSISSIQLDGRDISTYGNVQYYTRLGTNDQLPIVGFNRIVNGYPQDQQCLAGVPLVIPGTGTLTQALQVDVTFPDGVWVLTNDNNLIPAVITYLVEYSVAGANNWQPVLTPQTTEDVVAYHVNGDPYYPHPWAAVATDMPPNSGIAYALDDEPHNPGDPWTGTVTVEVFQPNGNHSTYQKPCRGEWQRTDPAINLTVVTEWSAGYQDFVACDRSVLYNRTSIFGLTPGKYDVRITKYGSARLHDNVGPGDNNAANIGQQVWAHSVNEVAFQDLSYPNMILLGIRALATNQISGSNLNVTALVQHGLRTVDEGTLPGALREYEEDNPACVAADMLIDELYGGGGWPGITAANLNRYIDEWVASAELNDELVDDGNGNSIRRHVFNGVFDDDGSLWNQVAKVAMMSRAAIIPVGKDYGVFTDQPDVPVQMFTMGNILDDSYQESWLAIDERANQVEMEFADSTRYYKTDNPLVYMDPANQQAGVVQKNVRIDGRGVTIPAQAWHLLRFKERCNQFLLRSGLFKCNIAAIACRPGNLIILQHDVPQFGWGGRTLPGSTASALKLDRTDIPFVAGTDYTVCVLHPALQRYAGTVTAVTPALDSAGEPLGTHLTLSSFDDELRVTRFVSGAFDSPIASSEAGSVIIQPCAGYTPAIGDAYTLFDTDVMESRPVTGISALDGSVQLGTPLSQAPRDFSVYFYGPTGSQKIVRLLNIKRADNNRATLEWIDYDPRCYIDAVPVIGETSAVVTSSPGVTSLTGSESFDTVGGSYVGFALLNWKPGKDTVGVGIYGTLGLPSRYTLTNAPPPQMLARLTGNPTTWKHQIDPGQTWTYTVVGFDAKDVYASIKSAPSVTVGAVGVAYNLLLGSNFTSGFTYWNILPRAGDTLVPSLNDDGEAIYTVQGSALTAAQNLLYQIVSPSEWSVGEFVLLSAYFWDSCADPAAPNVGDFTATVSFLDAAGAEIGGAVASAPLSGVSPNLVRANTPTPSTQIPAGTVTLAVRVGVSGTGLNIPVGSILTVSHFLLETSTAPQTAPSDWADIDASGQITDLFKLGNSTGLRAQGSTLPTFSGGFTVALTDTTAAPAWANLTIMWPDGGNTVINDGSLALSGLAASTLYYAYPYFDVVLGSIEFAIPAAQLGSPALLSTAFDPLADAATRQDGRVPLAPGGLTFTTTATGSDPGSGSGGGNSGGNPPGKDPVGNPQPPIGPRPPIDLPY